MADRPVPIVMREPPRGSVWGSEVREKSGLEMLRASIDHTLPDPPAARLTGLRLSEAGIGVASASMPASVWWQSGAGVFLAGTIAFVADLPLSCAVLTGAPAGVSVASSELSVSFVRPATIRSQSIIGRARLVHSTRSLGLTEAMIEDGRVRLGPRVAGTAVGAASARSRGVHAGSLMSKATVATWQGGSNDGRAAAAVHGEESRRLPRASEQGRIPGRDQLACG